MANLQYSSDLIEMILSRAGEVTDGTSDFDSEALIFLNQAYQALVSGGSELDPAIDEQWWWLRKDSQGVITLNPRIDDGTVAVTNNSASITFSSAPTPSVAGRHFKVNGHADVFTISAHTAGETGATLASVYTGTTNAAADYDVTQYDYDLAPDVLYLTAPMYGYQDSRRQIHALDLTELRDRYAMEDLHTGVPRYFAPIGEQKVRFSHGGGTSSTDLIKVDYEYVKRPTMLTDSNSEEPLVPWEYRSLLVEWALMYVYSSKEDTRAAESAALARNKLQAMALHNRRRRMFSSRVFGQIQPRVQHARNVESVIRTESGAILG